MATPSKSDQAGRRRRLNPDQRRAELLDAAVRVLRQQGPIGCRVEDITTEAGTAKGNFYRYFPAWDDLLVAVRDHLMDGYSDDARRRFGARTPVDWWQALEEEVDFFLEFQLGLGGLHRAIFHGPASQARPMEDQHSASALIALFLAGGIAEGAFGVVDIGSTAALLFHLLHGAADEIAAGANRDEIRRTALFVISRALSPTESAGGLSSVHQTASHHGE